MTAGAETTAFEDGLRGRCCWLELADGRCDELAIDRWHGVLPDHGDELMLSRCVGPTLDVGCGPGRLAATLAHRGTEALGIDTSRVAVELANLRGAPALRQDVFAALPSAGYWEHALLADGNVGIGGDPHKLLCRVGNLLSASGSILVEVEPHSKSVRRELVRTVGSGSPSEWFRWARVGADAMNTIADEVGMWLSWRGMRGDRCFAELSLQAPHDSAAAPGLHG